MAAELFFEFDSFLANILSPCEVTSSVCGRKGVNSHGDETSASQLSSLAKRSITTWSTGRYRLCSKERVLLFKPTMGIALILIDIRFTEFTLLPGVKEFQPFLST
ncbi:hypothetical protein CSKR_105178 [Clonorchis sinensis]|uniref:Uncharacterized protein n=1 Tax=Clonorchis sinensis TaxID=79923 RepID=A0A3R7CBP7_CLOSI|nr:hypothetical protein CSKR_105178 [Clonorchis sinensis]